MAVDWAARLDEAGVTPEMIQSMRKPAQRDWAAELESAGVNEEHVKKYKRERSAEQWIRDRGARFSRNRQLPDLDEGLKKFKSEFPEIQMDKETLRRRLEAYRDAEMVVSGMGVFGTDNVAMYSDPKDRAMIVDAVRDLAARNRPHEKAGWFGRTAEGFIRGGVRGSRTLRKWLPEFITGPDLTEDQELFRRELEQAWEGEDPVAQGNWLQRKSTEAAGQIVPMVEAGRLGGALGAGMFGSTASKTAATWAQRVGLGGHFLPEMSADSYYEMRAEGIDKTTASIAAPISGLIQAAVETVEIDPTGLLVKSAKQYAAKTAAGILMKYGLSYGKEWSEEFAQGVVDEVAQETARWYDEQPGRKGYGNAILNGLKQGLAAGGPLLFLVGPGSAVGAALELRDLKKAQQKGFVSEEDAKNLDLTPEEAQTRTTRKAAVTKRIAEAESAVAQWHADTTKARRQEKERSFEQATATPAMRKAQSEYQSALADYERKPTRERARKLQSTLQSLNDLEEKGGQTETAPPSDVSQLLDWGSPTAESPASETPPTKTEEVKPNASEVRGDQELAVTQGKIGEGSEIDRGGGVREPGKDEVRPQPESQVTPTQTEVPVATAVSTAVPPTSPAPTTPTAPPQLSYKAQKSQAWLKNTLLRRPDKINDNFTLAEWIRTGFDSDQYEQYLNETGMTLEEALEPMWPLQLPAATPAPAGVETDISARIADAVAPRGYNPDATTVAQATQATTPTAPGVTQPALQPGEYPSKKRARKPSQTAAETTQVPVTPKPTETAPVAPKALPEAEGFFAQKGLSWLRSTASRKPREITTPEELSKWVRDHFEPKHYDGYLEESGLTLEEAFGALMQAPVEKKSSAAKVASETAVEIPAKPTEPAPTETKAKPPARSPKKPITPPPVPAEQKTPPLPASAVNRFFENASDEELQKVAGRLGLKSQDRAGIIKEIEESPRLRRFLADKLPKPQEQFKTRAAARRLTAPQLQRDLETAYVAKPGVVKVEPLEDEDGFRVRLPGGRTHRVLLVSGMVPNVRRAAIAEGVSEAEIQRRIDEGAYVAGAVVQPGYVLEFEDGTSRSFDEITTVFDPDLADRSTSYHEPLNLAQVLGYFDSDAGKRIGEALLQKYGNWELVAQAREAWTGPQGLLAQIGDWIRRVLEPLRKAMGMGMSPELAMSKTFEEKFWTQGSESGYNAAGDRGSSGNQAGKQEDIPAPRKPPEASSYKHPSGDAELVSDPVNGTSVFYPVNYSLRGHPEWRKDALQQLREAGLSRDEATRYLRDLDDCVKVAMARLGAEGLLEPKRGLFPKGKPSRSIDAGSGVSPIQNISGYVFSLDFSGNCTLRFATTRYLNALVDRLKASGHDPALTELEREVLTAKLVQAAMMRTCLACYVETHRNLLGESAGKFARWYTGKFTDDDLSNAMSKPEEQAFQKKAMTLGLKPEDIDQSVFLDSDRWKKAAGVQRPANARGRGVIYPDADMQHPMNQSPLAKELYERIKANSSSQASSVFSQKPYEGNFRFLQPETITRTKLSGGQRMQSISDFWFEHAVDAMQAVWDLATVKSWAHIYTKFAGTYHLLKDTKVKVNFSTNVYIDDQGRYVEYMGQSFPWEEADKYASENPNAGRMLMGTNDDVILWGIRNPKIHQIIPWHHSGMHMGKRRAIESQQGWSDFTMEQNPKVIDPKKYAVFEQEYRKRVPVGQGGKQHYEPHWTIGWFLKGRAMSDKDITRKALAQSDKYGIELPFHRFARGDGKIPPFIKDEAGNWKKNPAFAKQPLNEGYCKLLKDYGRTDTPQETVVPNFSRSAFRQLMNEFILEQQSPGQRRQAGLEINPKVLNEAEKEVLRVRDYLKNVPAAERAAEEQNVWNDLIGHQLEYAPRGHKMYDITAYTDVTTPKMGVTYGVTPEQGKADGGIHQQIKAPSTPAFKEWFGDSKVVNKDGTPKAVYHGTTADFDEFSPRFTGDVNEGRGGFHFTDKASVAGSYPGTAEGANVKPVFLSIKNPFVMGPRLHGGYYGRPQLVADTVQAIARGDEDVSDLGADHQLKLFLSGELRKFIESNGLPDGIIIKQARWDKFNARGVLESNTQYIVWDPTQIKSATGNRGTFDPANPDISYSLKPGQRGIDALNEFLDAEEALDMGRTTGTKNVRTDELRELAGIEVRQRSPRQTIEDWQAEAEWRSAHDPNYAREQAERIVREGANKSQSEAAIEESGLGRYIRDLENQRRAGRDVRDELLTAVRAAEILGEEWGRRGVARQVELFSDFSMAGLVRKHLRQVGEEPTEQQWDKYEALAKKLDKAEADLAVEKAARVKAELDKKIAEAKLAHKKSQEEPREKRGDKRRRLRQEASDAVADFKREWAKLSQLGAIADPQQEGERLAAITKAAAGVVKAYAKLGVNSLLELMARVVEDTGPVSPEHAKAFEDAWNESVRDGSIKSPLGPNPKSGEVGVLAKQLLKWAVASGIEGREQVIDAVHGELQRLGLKLSRPEAMTAMSGYGEYQELSGGDIAKKVREYRGEMQQLLKLLDMQAGRAPLKTGMERREPSDDERDLIKLVNEAKRRGGYVVTDPKRQLSSALMAAKRAINNRIADLDKEITTGERIVKTRTELTPDTELINLRKRRDELLEQHRRIFPPKRGGLSDDQRLRMAVKVIERQIADLRSDLEAGRLESRTRDKSKQLSSPELDAKRAELEQLHKVREDARKASPEYQAKLELLQNERYRRFLAKRLQFWEDRLADAQKGKLPEKKKARVYDRDMLERRYKVELAKREAQAAIEEAERAARTTAGKVLGFGGDLHDLSRAMMTGWEMSAVMRQGAAYTLGFPLQAFPAVVKAFRAAVSRRADFAIHEDLMRRANAVDYAQGGLETTASEGPLSRREEFIRSRIASWLAHTESWGWAVPRWAAEGLLGSERAFRTFLNVMRADLFDYMKESIESTRPGTWSEQDMKTVGRFANILSGRAPMKHSAGLGLIFFAPRWMWSRVLLVEQTAGIIGGWRGDVAQRKAMGKVLVRAALGMGTYRIIAHLLYSLLSGDDDDDHKPQYMWNPLSSDWGKTRIGETRLDTGTGMNQLATFAARIILGRTKRADGKIVKIRGEDVDPSASDATDIITRFLRSKLSPTMSAAWDLAAGEDVVGNPIAPYEVALGRMTPMTWRDIWEAEKELNVPQFTVAALEAVFGVGLSTYGDRAKWRSADEAGRQELLEKKLKSLQWDSPEPGFRKYLTDEQKSMVTERLAIRRRAVIHAATAEPNRKTHSSEESYRQSLKERDSAVEKLREMARSVTHEEAQLALVEYYRQIDLDGKASRETDPQRYKGYRQRATKLAELYGLPDPSAAYRAFRQSQSFVDWRSRWEAAYKATRSRH